MKRKSYCVYLMGSLAGTLYIGVTGNLHKRIFEHEFHCQEGFTHKYDVKRLLYWESFDDVHKAIARDPTQRLASKEKDLAHQNNQPALARPQQRLVPLDEKRRRR